ncbi:MAG: ABC transporter substrate-binding protein [Candidatus Paceibacterota bacterium]
MENLYSRIRNFKLPKRSEINYVFFSFSERERVIFFSLVVVLLVSTIMLLENINKSFMEGVPDHGGSVSEGILGTPRFINPLLATSDADQGMVALIYSGLMRKTPDGTLIPDLAQNYEISKDGLTYTFTLKNNLFFQDGKSLTADDIIFTINKAKDPAIKSPRKISWDGVGVEKIDEKTIQFTLKQPYASFLENTTLGILPLHLWDGSIIELNAANTNPIGSGPFMINSVSKQSSGIIDTYTLSSYKKFILGKPYLNNITLHFYNNEDELVKAVENKTIEQASSIAPLNAEILKEENYQIQSSVLPRVFGIFFNQNQNQLFTNKIVVSAINQAIDKDKIVRDVLFGYGEVINSPIPPSIVAYQKSNITTTAAREEIVKKIQADLGKDGWKMGQDGVLQKTDKQKKNSRLEFSISTGNVPELEKTADLIKQDLLQVGIKVNIQTFEIGTLNQTIIRPRKYDALLFGEIINRESDLYAFWHSSQRKDPGLNVAMYTNSQVDKILEDASITVDAVARVTKYLQFEEIIKRDMPAVFLYSPNLVSVVSKNIHQDNMNRIVSPSDRYLNAYLWYSQTQNIWRIFVKK